MVHPDTYHTQYQVLHCITKLTGENCSKIAFLKKVCSLYFSFSEDYGVARTTPAISMLYKKKYLWRKEEEKKEPWKARSLTGKQWTSPWATSYLLKIPVVCTLDPGTYEYSGSSNESRYAYSNLKI